MRVLVYAILAVWVALLKVKRFFVPRGFRVVAVRRRCEGCDRRLRPGLVKRKAVAPLCRKCLRANMSRRFLNR